MNQQVRLTRREIERFVKIIDLPPENIRPLANFDACIVRCKAYYRKVPHDTRFLNWPIDRERDRCCSDTTSSGL